MERLRNVYLLLQQPLSPQHEQQQHHDHLLYSLFSLCLAGWLAVWLISQEQSRTRGCLLTYSLKKGISLMMMAAWSLIHTSSSHRIYTGCSADEESIVQWDYYCGATILLLLLLLLLLLYSTRLDLASADSVSRIFT